MTGAVGMRICLLILFITVVALGGCKGEGGQVGDEKSRELFASSMKELTEMTAAHEKLFQISRANWDLDQDAGTITFTSPDGTVATAPAQIVGTFNKADDTWLWAWDNPSIDEKLTANARLAKDFGGGHGPAQLIQRKFKSTEDKCWEYAAVTCKLGNHKGVYRGPADDTLVFITFGDVTLHKQQ
jgi:hypothetical protein